MVSNWKWTSSEMKQQLFQRVWTHHYFSDLCAGSWEEPTDVHCQTLPWKHNGRLLKMQTSRALYSNVSYIHIMGNTVPDNKNIHSYGEIWRALPPIRKHTGRQKLPSSFSTLWKTLLPIMLLGWEVYLYQGTSTDKQPEVISSVKGNFE